MNNQVNFDGAQLTRAEGGGSGGRASGDTVLTLWNGSAEVFKARLDYIIQMRELLGECADMLSRCAGDAEEAGYDQRAENIRELVERAMAEVRQPQST